MTVMMLMEQLFSLLIQTMTWSMVCMTPTMNTTRHKWKVMGVKIAMPQGVRLLMMEVQWVMLLRGVPVPALKSWYSLEVDGGKSFSKISKKVTDYKW